MTRDRRSDRGRGWLAGEVNKKVRRARRRGGRRTTAMPMRARSLGGRKGRPHQHLLQMGTLLLLASGTGHGLTHESAAPRTSSSSAPQLGSPIATAPMRKEVARQLLLGFPACLSDSYAFPSTAANLEDHCFSFLSGYQWVYSLCSVSCCWRLVLVCCERKLLLFGWWPMLV